MNHFQYLTLALLLLVGCSSTPQAGDGADLIFGEAEQAFKEERYLIAMEKFREVKNRYPYSPKAIEAELRVADTYFAQESYIEAASSYEIFRELHPTYGRGDYVQFQIAMSYYKQIPDNPARDLAPAHKAIESFDLLVAKYPSSSYVPQSKQMTGEAKKKLAEYENYVADLYFRRRHYLSASYRYAAILKDYPGFGQEEETLYRLGECYLRMKMYENARATYLRFLQQFPNSNFRPAVESALKEMPS